MFLRVLFWSLRRNGPPPRAADFDRFLEHYHPEAVRFLAYLEPGAKRTPKMLYSQRRALAAMPRAWQPVHRALWALYWPVARWEWARALWGLYRRAWPK